MKDAGKRESGEQGLEPGILQVETADEKWRVQVRRGVVLYAEETTPLTPPFPNDRTEMTYNDIIDN